MKIIDHVAAAPSPLDCPGRGAWPPSRTLGPEIYGAEKSGQN